MAKKKRITVMRMINNRITKSVLIIKSSHEMQELEMVLGGQTTPEQFEQTRANMRSDLEQLNFIKMCLRNKFQIIKIMQENE